ncbi:MAG: RHS repeat-associated core domain-containing protein, partial [Vulcanimicrobiota bacterium]
LGSVRELLDQDGNVVAEYRYSIYGERTKISGDLDSDWGFAGLFHHEPSGLDLATYRLYDAKQRRFISRDPLGEAVDYNLYRYAGNNPVSFTDPSGLDLSIVTSPINSQVARPGLGSPANVALTKAIWQRLFVSNSVNSALWALINAEGYDIKIAVVDSLDEDVGGGSLYDSNGFNLDESNTPCDDSGILEEGTYYLFLDRSFLESNGIDFAATAGHELGHAHLLVSSGKYQRLRKNAPNKSDWANAEEVFVTNNYENPLRAALGLDSRTPNTLVRDY